jgi:hypothetical protein
MRMNAERSQAARRSRREIRPAARRPSRRRPHAVPPCTITVTGVKEGLPLLDRALAVADRHTAAATG